MSETAIATITAACDCGAVRVGFSGPPGFEAICACSACQGRTGSAFGISAYFDRSLMVEQVGTPTVYRRMSDKGRALDFRFCPNCGTSVWWEAEFLADKIGVAGALLKGHTFRPEGAYFCATKPDWVTFSEDIPVNQRSSSR